MPDLISIRILCPSGFNVHIPKNQEKTNLRNFRIHKNGRQEWAVVEEEGRLSAIPTEEE